jgi:hypothetical protein
MVLLSISLIFLRHGAFIHSLVTIYGPFCPFVFIQLYFMSCFVKFDVSIICFESVIYLETKIVYLEKFYLSSSPKEHFVSRNSIFRQSESAVFE